LIEGVLKRSYVDSELLQTGRVVGLAFLALAAVDALPAGFAMPAGIGDVAIGLTAHDALSCP
jgi:hypothetical protein